VHEHLVTFVFEKIISYEASFVRKTCAETNLSETHVADSKGGRSPACLICLCCADFAGGFVPIWSVVRNISYFRTKLQFAISLSGMVPSPRTV